MPVGRGIRVGTLLVWGILCGLAALAGGDAAVAQDAAKPAAATPVTGAPATTPAAPAVPPTTEAPATGGDAAPAAEGAAPDASLSTSQEAIALRYKRFEKSLLELSEHMRKTDPDRATLLVRAIGKSKEARIGPQMEALAALLKNNQQFGEALERQGDLTGSLQDLLNLLMSEDRDKELAAEKARLERYIKDLNKIIAGQKDVRAATERGEPTEGLIPRQGKLSEKTRELKDEIDRDDAAKRGKVGDPKEGDPGDPKDEDSKPGDESQDPSDGDPSDGQPEDGKPGDGKPAEEKPGEPKPDDPKFGEPKPGEGKPGEAKPGEPKPGEGKPSEGKPGEEKPNEGEPKEAKPGDDKPKEGKPKEAKPGEAKPKDGKPGEPPEPSEGEPSEGEPMPGQSGESKPQPKKKPQQQDSTPGRDEIQRARNEMEKAIEKLKNQRHADASDKQDEALRELEKAKEKLEEILRQLREEERERFLAALEARFQEMLKRQVAINNDTVLLDKIPAAERAERHTTKAIQLSRQESELALDAEKALALLREEGTAVAFPEAVEQMRDDMRLVVGRLERVDAGELTQAIEEDIVDALKEMILALQKELEKSKEDQPPQDGQPKNGQPQDPQLVEKLAELKMLRSLQQRINGRTKRLGRSVDGEQALQPDIVGQLQKLSQRQARIQKATYDLATGRNE